MPTPSAILSVSEKRLNEGWDEFLGLVEDILEAMMEVVEERAKDVPEEGVREDMEAALAVVLEETEGRFVEPDDA